jgi:hypothetical protein
MSEQTPPNSETNARAFAPWVWGPLIFSYACLALLVSLPLFFTKKCPDPVCNTVFSGYAVGVIYFLIQGVGRLFQRRWENAICAIGRVLLLVFSLLPAFIVSFGIIVTKSSRPDHFADNLTIPDNIEIAAVLPEPPCLEGEEAPSPRKHLPISRPIGQDGPAISLAEGVLGGMFIATYRINGGEPGVVYLRAYEVTQGTRLSEPNLAERTTLRMPWSKNSKEVFTGEVACSIGEGDTGKPYAARFEVWFKPDSGAPERKLAERIFKIEGYQRHGA